MKRVTRLLIAGGFAAATLAATTGPAGADAIVDSYELGCSTFTASGTATSPWLGVEVYDNEAEEYLVYELVPVGDDGNFSFSLSWTPPSEPTASLYFGVWGTPVEDPDEWDEGEYFGADEVTCTPESTTTTTAPTPTTTPTTTVEPSTPTTAAPAVATAAVIAPTFTG